MFRYVFYVLLLALTSCVGRKSLVYFHKSYSENDRRQSVDSLSGEPALNRYIIREGDVLAVKITSLDPSIAGFFNIDADNKNNPYNEASVYLNSYSVNDSGCIELPVLGMLPLKGKKLSEVSGLIKNSLSRQLTNPAVSVRLVSFRITVLGEVRKPDSYKIYSDGLTVMEAIGMAGDITEFGNRKRVKVIRNSEAGHEQHYLNLTKSSSMESEFFSLMPGDVVFVEPIALRPLNTNLSPVRAILVGASIVILLLRITNNL